MAKKKVKSPSIGEWVVKAQKGVKLVKSLAKLSSIVAIWQIFLEKGKKIFRKSFTSFHFESLEEEARGERRSKEGGMRDAFTSTKLVVVATEKSTLNFALVSTLDKSSPSILCFVLD